VKSLRHVQRNGFHLFDSQGETIFIPDFLERFPETVLNKFLANTSFDSGFLMLSGAQQRAGWHMIGKIAHSPRISAVTEIPHDQFDEWLIFETPVEVKHFPTLVNYYGFSPVDFDWPEKIDPFWKHIANLNPLTLIGENDGFYLLTRDEKLAEAIHSGSSN